jgi:hypothetical protein
MRTRKDGMRALQMSAPSLAVWFAAEIDSIRLVANSAENEPPVVGQTRSADVMGTARTLLPDSSL